MDGSSSMVQKVRSSVIELHTTSAKAALYIQNYSDKIVCLARYVLFGVVSLTLLNYFGSKICIDNTNRYNNRCVGPLDNFDCFTLYVTNRVLCVAIETIEKVGVLKCTAGLSLIGFTAASLMKLIRKDA
jgi:hypothetical protein